MEGRDVPAPYCLMGRDSTSLLLHGMRLARRYRALAAMALAGCGGAQSPWPSPRANLRASEIRDVVIAHRGALMACYDLGVAPDTRPAGKVTLRWRIGTDGGTSEVSVANSTLHNARVEGCLARQVQAWRFPGGEESQVNYPFAFGGP
jgi:hypothetical protein